MPLRRRPLLAAPAALALARRAHAEEVVRIGHITPLTGPSAELGSLQLKGARLALERVNAAGGVLGRRMELVTEDNQGTNPGAVLAFSRLAGRSDIAAFFSGTASTQTHAIEPDVLKAARPVMILATDPKLTHMGDPWFFRCRPNDVYSARVMATFGAKELGGRKWAIVHSTDAFGTAGMRMLTEELGKLGLKPAMVQGYSNGQPDYTPIVLAVKGAEADLVASYFTFDNDVAAFARQLRQLGVDLPWIGSPSTVGTSAMRLAGRALHGTYAVADFAADSSPEARDFTDRFARVYGVQPDLWAASIHDGLTLLARAMNAAGGTEPEKVRAALLAIRGFRGLEGEYNFDANGDGLHGYNVVRNVDGRIVFQRHIEFTD